MDGSGAASGSVGAVNALGVGSGDTTAGDAAAAAASIETFATNRNPRPWMVRM